VRAEDTEKFCWSEHLGGYFVSTIGRVEEMIRTYIRNRERLADVGAVEPLALTGHFSGRLIWAASATSSAALSGQHSKAPGFAGGYLLRLPKLLGAVA
jgi:hypothetical protein